MIILIIILIAISVILLAGFIWLARFPKKLIIKKSKIIESKLENVFDFVIDFNNWNSWSPWTIHEPNAKITISDISNKEGSTMEWDGKIIGSGKLEITKIVNNRSLFLNIYFYKPFKSKAKIIWNFDRIGRKTRVVWIMRSQIPFLFRFMYPKLKKLMGKDYEVGLDRIEMILDPKVAQYNIEFAGERTRPKISCLCRNYKIKFSNFDNERLKIRDDFTELGKFLGSDIENIDTPHFSVINSIDKKNDLIDIDYCYPAIQINKNSIKIPKDVGFVDFDSIRCFVTKFQGDLSRISVVRYLEKAHCRMIKNTIGLPIESYKSDEKDNFKINFYRKLSN